MKNFFKGILAISVAAASVFGLSACEPEDVPFGAMPLGTPLKATMLDYKERNEYKYGDINRSAEKFAADFADIAYKQYGEDGNFAVSPISVYMALSLAAQCSADDTQSEILSTLGISYDTLKTQFSYYYRSVFAEYTARDETDKKIQTGMIKLTNSVWLDSHTTAKQECIDTLAEKYFCYSYHTDFHDDNAAANQAVQKFVKENTNGLIDQNFELSKDTVFALINTLYLKDFWNMYGNDLLLTENDYNFAQSDGSIKNIKLLQGYSNNGRVVESDSFKTFFTRTANGNKINFILPKDGYTVDDVFTAENISKVKNIESYKGVDDEKKQRFYTRCLFPEYTASFDGYITSILKQMGITAMFDSDKCDFTNLTDDDVYCDSVIHTTKLKVDRKGIEGAAVTIIVGAGAAGPDEYENVYLDFVIDRAFGFIISDAYGNTLFSGVVNKV